jgi:hypothetical protein
MAPEQVLGRAFDGRLDIYALGCTAYELLTGAPPFDADDVTAILGMQLADPPLPPTARRPDLPIPAELEAVILKCLAKSPEDRYQDMADLEAALCEAQVAARIHTSWDDLPLPELSDAERRERLLRNMPSLHAPIHRSAWFWPLLAGTSTVAAAGLGLFLAMGQAPTNEDVEAVEALVGEVRSAATKANWVVPPHDDADAPTAYAKVLELEALEGKAESLADEKGLELRGEIGTTLVSYGNQLWDAGARAQARDYYLWAHLFDEDNAQALERSAATPGTVADLRERARTGDFNEAERITAIVARAEAAEDPQEKEKLLRQADAAMEATDLSTAGTMVLAKARARNDRRGTMAEPPPPPEPEPVEAIEPIEIEVDPESELKALPETSPPIKAKRRRSRSVTNEALLGNAASDPEQARVLADQGTQAASRGQRKQAASLFHQAISFDRRNGTALMGLSDIYFDTGENQKAVMYAEKAVAASPSHHVYRVKLGDAYFKVLRYKDALEQYERAKTQGSTRAEQRIAKVNAKLGG